MRKLKPKKFLEGCLVIVLIVIILFVYRMVTWMRIKDNTLPPSDNSNNVKALLKPGSKILAVTGHPDDLEFYAGGTMARIKGLNDNVVLMIGTDGGKEKYGIKRLTDYMVRIRRKETEDAAKFLGYKEIILCSYPDGNLKAHQNEFADKIAEEIKEFKPDIVLTFDTDRQIHPDHLTAGRATMEAIIKMSIHPEIFLFSSGKPNTWVDVSNTINDKWEALELHKSQFGGLKFYMVKNLHLEREARHQGRKIGVKYAETFRRVK